MRKNQCKPRHLSAIYNSLVLVPLLTWAIFIGDNERKRWDASLLLPSPQQCSFISPSHKADSPLVTPAAASLKIDNKVSEMKTGGQLQARLLLGFKLLRQWRALLLSWHFHLSGLCSCAGTGRYGQAPPATSIKTSRNLNPLMKTNSNKVGIYCHNREAYAFSNWIIIYSLWQRFFMQHNKNEITFVDVYFIIIGNR